MLLLWALWGQGFIYAQTNPIRQPDSIVQAINTNVTRASIDIASFHGKQLISVSLNIGPFNPQYKNKRFIYYIATNFKMTNSFCGPIELKDAEGHNVPLLRPEINSLEAYPASTRVSEMGAFLHGNGGDVIYSGPPLPIAIRWSPFPLCDFYLTDYFKVEKPGDYKLTVWPKIYQRIAPTNDICCRIDLSPITTTITWNGK